jgi:hypothetical protein
LLSDAELRRTSYLRRRRRLALPLNAKRWDIRLAFSKLQVEAKDGAPAEQLPNVDVFGMQFEVRDSVLTQTDAVCDVALSKLPTLAFVLEQLTKMVCSNDNK